MKKIHVIAAISFFLFLCLLCGLLIFKNTQKNDEFPEYKYQYIIVKNRKYGVPSRIKGVVGARGLGMDGSALIRVFSDNKWIVFNANDIEIGDGVVGETGVPAQPITP